MIAPADNSAITLLLRAGLFAAVLALIAGIFGMHVMTATHAMHSPAALATTVSAHHDSSHSAHAGVQPPGIPSVQDTPAAQDEAGAATVQCTDLDNCTSMQSMTAACTPSAKSSSLAAPLPGTAIIARNTSAAAPSTMSARWSYRPGSPSPGELCISRT